jgi:hypothetical protein
LDGPSAGATTVADAQYGRFCLYNVIESQFRVSVQAAGFIPAERIVTLAQAVPTSEVVFLRRASTYKMNGFVSRWGTTTPVPGAAISIVAGANVGRSTTAGGVGQYEFTSLSSGALTVRVSASGYTTEERPVTLDASKIVNFALTPVPVVNTCGPRTASCGTATAVCRDGWLSCSQNRSGTCSSHGGVQCWICPGRLCG